MPTAISKDGTSIAYEKTGHGPCLIVVNGALSSKKMLNKTDLTSRLAKDFTVLVYDRRGRGESTDTQPYAVEREIEDLEALVEVAGGSAYLFGSSSGACLAMQAAQKLGPGKIIKLALYEPPYPAHDEKSLEQYTEEKKEVNARVKKGKPGDAVTFFLEKRGTPPEKLEELKKSPDWKEMEQMGHTLVYDFEVMGNGVVPTAVAKDLKMPTLVMDGEKSFDFIHTTAEELTGCIQHAVHKTLKGQTHQASPEALQPELKSFFAGSDT